MNHFFVTPDAVGEELIRITGSDVNHIRNVLRMRTGEQITVSCGEEAVKYRCELESLSEDTITARILWVQEEGVELSSRICLFQGLPKADKMEWIIQKNVELGVSAFVPMQTRRAVVKLDARKEDSKLKRWRAISESAAKQSGRGCIPEVHSVMTFAQAVKMAAEQFDHCLIPYELAKDMQATRKILDDIRPGESVAVFIGPEGGFAPEEVALAKEAGIIPVTLGRRILRTETAGMALAAALMFRLEGM